MSFLEAMRKGYPPEGGLFCPADEIDIRTAVYAPSGSFAETVALAAPALFPDDIDPYRALAVAERVFVPPPATFAFGEDILIIDLARGPTRSAADYSAAFTAEMFGLLASLAGGVEHYLPFAAAEGKEAAALVTAFTHGATSATSPACLLLGAEDGLAGLDPEAFEQGRALFVGIEGGKDAALRLERSLAGLRAPDGRFFVPVGKATPARLTGRLLVLLGLFTQARRGIASDLLVATPPGDGFGLVTGLWAWSWGLPVSAFIVARVPESGGNDAFGAQDEGARGLIARFARDYPLGSLALCVEATDSAACAEAMAVADQGGPPLDRASAFALAAARRALDAGFGGHARIVVPRFADPAWDLAGPSKDSRLRPRLPSFVIPPDPAALIAALKRV